MSDDPTEVAGGPPDVVLAKAVQRLYGVYQHGHVAADGPDDTLGVALNTNKIRFFEDSQMIFNRAVVALKGDGSVMLLEWSSNLKLLRRMEDKINRTYR